MALLKEILNRFRMAFRQAFPRIGAGEGTVWPWLIDVDMEAGQVIGEFGDKAYRIPYTDTGGEITFAAQGEWQEVERVVTWEAKSTDYRKWYDAQDALHEGNDLKFGDAVKVSTTGKVSGLLVRFTTEDELDTDDEHFDAKTDYGFDAGEEVSSTIYYHHGLTKTIGPIPIGTATLKMVEAGVFIDGQLAVRKRYEERFKDRIKGGSEAFIQALSEKVIAPGKAGWSSGVLPSLVRRSPTPNGKGMHIDNWPLTAADASITVTPADPGNRLATKTIKDLNAIADPLSLSDPGGTSVPAPVVVNVNIGDEVARKLSEASSPEAAVRKGDGPSKELGAVQDATDNAPKSTPLAAQLSADSTQTTIIMDREKMKAAFLKAGKNEEEAEALVEAAFKTDDTAPKKKSVEDIIKAHEASKAPPPETHEEAVIKAYETGRIAVKTNMLGYASDKAANVNTKTAKGDSHKAAFMNWIHTGDEVPLKSAGKEAYEEYNDDDEGDARKAAYTGDLGAQGGFTIPVDFQTGITEKRDETSIVRASGATVIGTQLRQVPIAVENGRPSFTFTGEDATINESEGTLNEVVINVHKATFFSKISNDLLADTTANLETFFTNQAGRAEASHENEMVLIGNGSNQPQGVLVGGTLGKTFASATAITAAEVHDLYYALAKEYRTGATWTMGNLTEAAIFSLTGNPFLFQLTPAGTAEETLLRKPVFNSDSMPAMSSGLKSITINNWEFYVLVERAGLTVTRNQFLYELNDQTAFFFRKRWGGAVTLAEAHQYGKQA